jgi:hypothetical protein
MRKNGADIGKRSLPVLSALTAVVAQEKTPQNPAAIKSGGKVFKNELQ